MVNDQTKKAAGPIQHDFSNISPEAIRELHRQAEACLQGTVQLAIAADQRATTMAGVLGAASAGILAVIATMATGPAPNWSVICAAIVAGVVLFIGALFAALAARPTDFHVGGYEPRRMAASARDETWILRYATEDLQVRTLLAGSEPENPIAAPKPQAISGVV